MRDIFKDMPLFVEVARQKSFSHAADILDIPVSTLSRRISAMEKGLGVPLLRRNSRNVDLTDSGKRFFERCDFIVSDAVDACETVIQDMKNPSGRIRLSMPGDVYHSFLTDALSSFAVAWPGIHLSVSFSDRWVDLLTEPYDLELRVGIYNMLPDSSLKMRKLGSGQSTLFASPQLLEKYFVPQTPDDLARIPCISLMAQGDVWQLSNETEEIRARVQSSHTFSSMSASLEFALAGLGVACIAYPLAASHLEAGTLVPVLDGWGMPASGAFLVMSGSQPHRVRLFIDHLVSYFDHLAATLPLAKTRQKLRHRL
jgi:DNA-binding transcriptional LysR family regulator